jgi:PLP dependent protein
LADIKLVAVSKAQPVEKIRAAIESGLTVFGENYPEESELKILTLQNEFSKIEWHMIGHLQSRKADLVCRYFAMLHSLDNLHLAEKLNRILATYKKRLSVLLEVNISGESSKSGWMAANIQQWEMLFPDFEKILTFDHLEVRGLMIMPPLEEEGEKSRPYFTKLRQLQDFLRKNLAASKWDELSMGTSFDYEIAIEEGATLIRVGEAIFGKRTYPKERK